MNEQRLEVEGLAPEVRETADAHSAAHTRRRFLQYAPLGMMGVGLVCSASAAHAQVEQESAGFQLFTAAEMENAREAQQDKPGNLDFLNTKGLPLTITLTTEGKKSQRQFEYHEARDHLFQILSGATAYEVGGKAEGAHSEKPGEWHAPSCLGATLLHLKAGDTLLIPRGTPHRRVTEEHVTLVLISITGKAA